MADFYAASVEHADVVSALALIGPGDTLYLPAGAATWTTTVGTLPASARLAGAGAGQTVITVALTGANATGLTISSNCVVENLSMVQADSATSTISLISGGASQGFVIRFCAFSEINRIGLFFGTGGSGVHPNGVVHNCTLTAKNYETVGGGTFHLVRAYGGESNYPPFANTNAGGMSFDPGFGSADAVFVEDCTLSQNARGDSSIETYTGAKVVVRHNNCTNFGLGIHGRDSSLRSGHIVEVYRNTINNTIGSAHFGTVLSRGCSGVVWENTVTGDGGNMIVLQNYRSAGRLPASEANRLLRFPYQGGQHDGHHKADGNLPITNGSGTHDGANGAAVLADSTKDWGSLVGEGDFTLTNELQSLYLWNRTKNVGGRIIANTGTTATVDRMVYAEIENVTADYSGQPLTERTRLTVHTDESALFPATPFLARVWEAGTDSSVADNFEIINVTAIAAKQLTFERAQSGTSALAIGPRWNISVDGGARLTWDAGDAYVITDGYPGLDQNGWTGPTVFYGTYATQTLNPWYGWGNTYNGTPNSLLFSQSYMTTDYTDIHQPDSAVMCQENREYYNNTERPGYTPYTYPHPLRNAALPSNPARAHGKSVFALGGLSF